jgi:DNA-binding CsgD family transcriptional regulator
MDVLSRPLGPVAEAARRLRGVQRAVARLSSLDSVARLVAAAPREACRAVGFERAMLSHIRGDRITFASVSFEADPIMAADFARLARAVRPRLDRCAPEHETVVRQMPVLVGNAQTAPGVFRPLTHVARTEAYVVAPIVRDLVAELRTGAWPEGDAVPAAPSRLTTLTAREEEVLQLMSEGASNAAIGDALVISQATVKSHVRHILRKLRAANRTEAVSLYLAERRR